MKYALCIPAYNEEQYIGETLRLIHTAFAESGTNFSIIVAENGSTDRTKQKVLDSKLPNIRLVSIPTKGKGAALRAAVEAVDADIIGFTDADLPIEPHIMLRMFELVASGNCDIVKGSRFHPETRTDRTIYRTASSKLFNFLARIITGVRHHDTQCPAQVMNRKAAALFSACREDGWFLDLEFIRRAEREGLRIAEVPVVWRESFYPSRSSKLSLMKDGFQAVYAMIRIRKNLGAIPTEK